MAVNDRQRLRGVYETGPCGWTPAAEHCDDRERHDDEQQEQKTTAGQTRAV
ncbi:MAG: hypothetical protein ABI948_06610 [Thermoleophilia bacterium]